MKTGRFLFAYIAYFIEILSAVTVFRGYFSSPNVEIGFEIVLIIGTLTSCLLLPLEEYSLAQHHEGGGSVTPLLWQQSVDNPSPQSGNSSDYERSMSFDSIAYQLQHDISNV